MENPPKVPSPAESPFARSVREKLEAERREREAKTRDCPTCGQPYYPSRHWQRFCSLSCKNKYHNDQLDFQKEQRATLSYKLELEKEELVKENSELRKEILRLDTIIKKLKE